MSFSAGARLGVYEVIGALGAGGMGEVYRARDTRLGREVAIKVLPPEVASDPSRLRRFEKEARSASALNHPNIVTIYEVGSSDSVSYIAMERVEGKTLRELLFGGALSIRKVLTIAAQTADGLAKAHEAGIVHRDLKPENVMVTRDGLVKILDFGLAKLTTTGSGSDEASHLPTETGTSPGMVLGTVGYMSPEQAAGQPVDFRSDQFSLGSILYEMATGKRAFQKKTAVDTLSAILNEEPVPVAEINPQAPAPLRWIVERCLAKDPDARFASTKDLARDLIMLRDHLSEASLPGALSAAPARRNRPWMLGLAAGLAILTAIVAVSWRIGSRARKETLPSFHQVTFRHGALALARFAQDGQTIVYSAQWEGRPYELFTARLGSPESRPVGFPATNILSISSLGEMAVLQGELPFLGTLSRASLSGGAPRELLENVYLADWAPDGKDLAVLRALPGKPFHGARLEFPIGKKLYESEGTIWCPRVSPTGKQIAFVEEGLITLIDRDGIKRSLGVSTAGKLHCLAWFTAEEIWFRAGSEENTEIRAVTLSGKERKLISLPGNFVLQDVLSDGRVLLERDTESWQTVGAVRGDPRERSLSWLDHSEVADITADGTTLLFNEIGAGAGGAKAIYLRKSDGSPAVRLGDGSGVALSPDGKWVLAMAPDKDPFLLPTRAGETRSLPAGGIRFTAGAFFPDGNRVLLMGTEAGHKPRLYVQDIAEGLPRPATAEDTVIAGAANPISPDGRTVVARNAERINCLYSLREGEIASARPIPGGVRGEALRWGSDDRSVFILKGNQEVYRVDSVTGQKELWKTFRPTEPIGSGDVSVLVMASDGNSYAYTYNRYYSDLFLVEGLR